VDFCISSAEPSDSSKTKLLCSFKDSKFYVSLLIINLQIMFNANNNIQMYRSIQLAHPASTTN
jgi:hypothetical protein